MSTTNYAIIVAGGKGQRMNSTLPKQFMEVSGQPVLLHTINKFLSAIPDIRIILVLPSSGIESWEKIKLDYSIGDNILSTRGGETRFDSVRNGLKVIDGDGIVAIHDAVRPCVAIEVIRNCFKVAEKQGSALPVVSLKDSIRKVADGNSKSVDRNSFKLVQTPQTFRISEIKSAFNEASHNGFTDDASVYENSGRTIRLVDGNYENIKITTPDDLNIAQIFLSNH